MRSKNLVVSSDGAAYLHVEGLEGRAVPRELVHTAAEAPDVAFEAVRLIRQQLGTHVIGRAHHTSCQLVLLQHARQPEVADAHVAVAGEEQVRALQGGSGCQ